MSNCLLQHYVPLDPASYGWKFVDTRWEPIWFEGKPLPDLEDFSDDEEASSDDESEEVTNDEENDTSSGSDFVTSEDDSEMESDDDLSEL